MPKNDRLTRLIDDLIQKSEAATPGPWEKSALATGYIVHCDGKHHEIIASVVEYAPDGSIAHTFDNAEANAAYIAACTPETIREICKAHGRALGYCCPQVHHCRAAGQKSRAARADRASGDGGRLPGRRDRGGVLRPGRPGLRKNRGQAALRSQGYVRRLLAQGRRESVATDTAPDPSTMPLRGGRVAWTSMDKA